MSKAVADAVLDAAFDVICTATRLDICSDVGTPTDLTNTLANVTLTAGDGNGDYVVGAGDVSGRKVRVGAQADVPVTGTGSALHYVLSLAGTILAVTTCTSQVLTSGNTVDIPVIDFEMTDPT